MLEKALLYFPTSFTLKGFLRLWKEIKNFTTFVDAFSGILGEEMFSLGILIFNIFSFKQIPRSYYQCDIETSINWLEFRYGSLLKQSWYIGTTLRIYQTAMRKVYFFQSNLLTYTFICGRMDTNECFDFGSIRTIRNFYDENVN